jgi:hypothetical protein
MRVDVHRLGSVFCTDSRLRVVPSGGSVPAPCKSNVQRRSASALRGVACVVALLAGTAWTGSPCWAGQVPDNAQSRSLQMRPEFLDDVSLLFLYPQRAGVASSGIVSFVRDGGIDGLGAVGNTHSNGLFLLLQPGRGTLGNNSLVQAGWGGSWSGVRFGLAFRGGHDVSEDINRQQFPPPAAEEFSGDSQNFTRMEGAFGVGVEVDRLELDVEAEITREDITLQFARVDSDTMAASIENTADPFWGTAGRLGIRLTPTAELIAVGSWVDNARQTLEGLQLADSRVSSVRLEQDFERWSAGVAIRFETPRIDLLSLSSHWDRNETPIFQFRSYNGKQRLDTARFGISVQHRLWRELEGRAGLEARYQKSVTELRQDQPGRYTLSSTATTKDVSQLFAWGVSYEWRNFEVRTSVEQTLDLLNLFVALDLIVEL